MRLIFKYATLLGCFALAGLLAFLFQDHQRATSSIVPQTDEPAHKGVRVLNNNSHPSPAFASTDDAPPRSATTTPVSSRSWDKAIVLRERIEEPNAANSWQTLRHRIVKDDGFDHPIRITDRIDFDRGTFLAEVSAYAANQVILHSSTPLAASEVIDIAEALGWDYLEGESTRFVAVLQANEAEIDTVTDALRVLERFAIPLEAEPNHIFYTSLSPNDAKYASNDQWSLHNDGDTDIDAPEGWDNQSSAPNVTIAVVDTGLRLDHEDLLPNLWVNSEDSTYNGKDDDNNGYIDDVHGINGIDPRAKPWDANGHGTHVAGIAGAAGNNGKGIAGVAWSVKLMAIKALNADGKGAASNIVKSIDYAVANGANIINASWGSDSDSAAIEQAIVRAKNKGVFIVTAAGNDQREYASYPARSPQPNVVSVGSVNDSGELSSFSNYNATDVDVLAPGDNLISTWHETPDAYSTQSGTSMAAPIVSGVLALTIARFPDDDLTTLKQRLIVSSEKSDSLAFASASGGMVNLNNALALERVPFPPILLETSAQTISVYEDSPVTLWAKTESHLPLTFRWYFNDQAFDSSTFDLTISSISAEQAGEYRLDIATADAAISVVFTVIVYPRLSEIEALMGNEIAVFGSNNQHWELTETDGVKLITNRELPRNTKAFLTFRASKPGLLRFEGRREQDPRDQYSTYFYGPGTYTSIYRPNWETFDASSEEEGGFTTTIEHTNEHHPEPTESNILYLKIPRFFAFDKLPPIFRERLDARVYPVGGIAFFSVLSEQTNLSYQWYKDNQPIEGKTGNALSITVSSAEVAGKYYVIATNEYGSLKSSSATLEVDTSPQPARVVYEGDNPLTIVAGDPFSIPMSVFGADPISYQWYRNGHPIPGAISREINLGISSPAHNGTYYLTVKNALQDYTNESARIDVNVSEQIFPPRFSMEDERAKTIVIAEGQSLVTGPATPAGSIPMEYVWYKDGTPSVNLPSSPHLTFEEIKTEDAGVYYLEARNNIGTDQSGRITIQVTSTIAEALDTEDIHLLTQFPKTNDANYIISQSKETWDGIDALEVAVKQWGSQTIEFDAIGKDALLRFRWKSSVTDGLEFEYRNAEHDWQELHSNGSWKEEILFIRDYQSLQLRLESNASSAKIWLDDFAIIQSPHILQQVSYDIPRIGQQVVLRPKLMGDDLNYEWFKDGEPISGATGSSLTFDSYAMSDAGNYELKISNEHGEATTRSAEVRMNILNTVVQDGINLTFTGSAKTRILAPSNESQHASILIESEAQAPWGFESQITGPVSLEMSYDFGSSMCFLSIDETQVQIPAYGNDTQTYTCFIPSGTHSVRVSLEPSSNPFVGHFYEVKLRDGPIGTLKPSVAIHYDEPDVPRAEYAGAAPLSLNWYKDGKLLSTQTNLKPGVSYPYYRRSVPLDHGEYHLEITDKDGLTAVSEKVFFSQMNKLAQVIDFRDHRIRLLDQSFSRAYFDTQLSASGGSSLALEGPFNRDASSSVRLDVRAAYATFQLRSQGFPEGSAIRYVMDGAQLELATNTGWQEVIVQTQDGRFFLELPEGSEDSTVWIDQMTTFDRAVFTEQPLSISTYIGARIEFEATAYFDQTWPNLQLTWLKDGREVKNESWASLLIESVQNEDLGEYVARAISPDGDVIYSEPATLSLTAKELSSAIGYPGARITTYGYSPWQIDYEDSIDGPSSIISGPLQNGESSWIIIEIDDTAAWGVYSYTLSDYNPDYIDTALDNKWLFETAVTDSQTNTQKVTLSVREFGIDNVSLNRRLRLDGVRVTKFGDARYDTWIKKRTIAATVPSSSQDRTSDLDGDGIPNWLEFTLNLDPTKHGPLPATGLVSAGGTKAECVFQFFAARSGDYSITYETSYDLDTWESARPILETVSSTQEYDEIKATVKADPTRESPFFVRWTIHNLADNSQGTFSTRQSGSTVKAPPPNNLTPSAPSDLAKPAERTPEQ